MIINKFILEKIVENNSIKQSAFILGVCPTTIKNYMKKYKLSKRTMRLSKYPNELSKIQQEFITGSLLGDGSISKKDNLFTLSQKENSLEYVLYCKELLNPFCKYLGKYKTRRPNNKNEWLYGHRINTISHPNKNEWLYGHRINTISHPIFKKLRSQWYPQGIKIIPKDIKLTPFSLAIWHMEDGSNRNSKHSKDVRLNTQGFALKYVKLLIQILKRDLNIISHITYETKLPVIFIPAASYINFINIVTPYIEKIKCFHYKIDISNTPSDKIVKTTPEIIQAIENDRNKGLTQKQIAIKFGLCQPYISRLLKYKSKSSKINPR